MTIKEDGIRFSFNSKINAHVLHKLPNSKNAPFTQTDNIWFFICLLYTSRGETYPNGSAYVCEFSGKFTDIEQIDEYSYTMNLSEININSKKDSEWIQDGIRYIPSDPYGLEKGKDFIFYLPQTPLEGLSEEFLSWWPGRYLQEEEAPKTLSYYGPVSYTHLDVYKRQT